MNTYHVTFGYVDEHGETHWTDQGVFHADSETDAEECAIDAWWDPRLETASCSPYCEVEAIGKETDDDAERNG